MEPSHLGGEPPSYNQAHYRLTPPAVQGVADRADRAQHGDRDAGALARSHRSNHLAHRIRSRWDPFNQVLKFTLLSRRGNRD